MITVANVPGGYEDRVLDLRGLSSDSKPTDVGNGSTFLEMDTGKVYAYDKANQLWREL